MLTDDMPSEMREAILQAEIERLRYREKLLQHVIDIRPAKNAGLVASYENWTNNIYMMEANDARELKSTEDKT